MLLWGLIGHADSLAASPSFGERLVKRRSAFLDAHGAMESHSSISQASDPWHCSGSGWDHLAPSSLSGPLPSDKATLLVGILQGRTWGRNRGRHVQQYNDESES